MTVFSGAKKGPDPNSQFTTPIQINIDIDNTNSYTAGNQWRYEEMANIKTAISIDKPIFEEVNDLAKNLNISRSRVFALAAKEFIQRHKNLKLLNALNEAYDDLPESEQAVSKMRPRHYNMVKDQW